MPSIFSNSHFRNSCFLIKQINLKAGVSNCEKESIAVWLFHFCTLLQKGGTAYGTKRTTNCKAQL